MKEDNLFLWAKQSINNHSANIMREFQRDQGCKRIQIRYTSSINAFQKRRFYKIKDPISYYTFSWELSCTSLSSLSTLHCLLCWICQTWKTNDHHVEDWQGRMEWAEFDRPTEAKAYIRYRSSSRNNQRAQSTTMRSMKSQTI